MSVSYPDNLSYLDVKRAPARMTVGEQDSCKANIAQI